MASAIFWPTQLTYQSRPIVNLFNFCVFHPILIRFGLGANIGLKTTWNEFQIDMAFFWPTKPTNQCRPIANILNFYILVPFAWNLVCELIPPCYSPAALLLPCSSPAPASDLLLPYSCPAPIKLLSCTFLALSQFLPSSFPLYAHLCFSLFSSTPALFLPSSCPAPASALLLLSSWPAPGLLLPCSCPPQFGSLHNHKRLTTFFGIVRATFYGNLFSHNRGVEV